MASSFSSYQVTRLKTFSKAAGPAVALLGGLPLFGLILDVSVFKRNSPSLASMNARTALAFVLAGFSLWLLQEEPLKLRNRLLAQVNAVAVGLIGLFTLSELFLGWRVGIEQWLFRDLIPSTGEFNSERMAPIAALSLVLVGSGLLLLSQGLALRLAQTLALGVAALTLMTHIAYAYDIQSLYLAFRNSVIVFPTTLAFLILSAAIFSARPDHGLMTIIVSARIGGFVARRLLPAAVVIPPLLGWLHLKFLREGFYGSGFGLALLMESVTGIASVFVFWIAQSLNRLEAEREGAKGTIQRLTFFDPLTGLPNRNMLYDRLLDKLRTDQGQDKRLALLLMDLVHFKEINDTLGHVRGDEILKQVGQRLREAMLTHDVVARHGGDEFSVLLLNMSRATEIDAAVQKILKALDRGFLIDNLPIRVEISIGIALCPEHGTEAEALFQRADIALHECKKTGISSIVYDPAQDRHSPERLALMSDLHYAIERAELLLHYQPKISGKSRRVIGVEALVRWKHPQRGMIPPDQFILPAEQTGLIHPLTRWVLIAAMAQCKAWRQAGLSLSIAVNLSARNLLDPKLPDLVAGLLRSYGVSSKWMTFEITESTIMGDPDYALRVLTQFHEMGIRMSIDDFGIGYSSLSYLQKLPVDKIKIDKSFVIKMTQNQNDAVIVHSTIDLAHNLGFQVVAEGVETRDIWDRLSALGCDEGQGYYMARPMPVEDLTRWLSESPWGLNTPDVRRERFGESAA